MTDKITDSSDAKEVVPETPVKLQIEIETEETVSGATAVVAPPVEVDSITAKLNELGVTAADTIERIKGLGAESVDDLSSLQEADLTGIGVPTLKARKLVSALQNGKAAATPGVDMGAAAVNIDTVLPSVPDDSSWLNALRSGGVLKIEQSTVISAIRAALADRFGLYDIPRKLVGAMEAFVEVTEEQVGEEFWQIRKQLTRKSYGDLFQAIDGLDGSFVTDKRKNELLGRIDENLWPSIVSFNSALAGWQDAWVQGAGNPAMMMSAMASLAGAGGVGMPPGMMQPPDCGVVRDAAETVNDALNRTFRGTGVQIAAALAFEANGIKAMLENPRLPMLCGLPSRDMLLKKLKVDVPATYPRMETNVTKFVLGIMQADKVGAGNEELQYFGTLFMLGSQIPWGDLEQSSSFQDAVAHATKRPRGIGS